MPEHPLPRPNVLATPPAHHGSIDDVELSRLGLTPDDVLDFSVNSNPYGPSPRVREALACVPLDRYPDRDALALRLALSAHLDQPVAHILAGNGTAELLLLVALAFLNPGDSVLIIGPTFGEYERVSALLNAKADFWTARPEASFALDPAGVSAQLHILQPRVTFICNPNNPTGTFLAPEVIGSWVRAQPGTLFVVDESYLAFGAGCRSTLALGAANVLVLRSMTKDYALAGLRLGYAVGPEMLIAALSQVRPAWNVNALAQAAGVAALSDQTHLSSCLAALTQGKEELMGGLAELGWVASPSVTHYFLVPVGDAASLRHTLLQRRILVRDCASFGLPAHIRVATRRHSENMCLLEVLREVRRGRSV